MNAPTHHSAQQPFFKALIFYMDGVFADSDPKSLPQSLLAVFPSTAVFKTPACGAPPWGVRYIHYNGLYSSRCKAQWQRWHHLARVAPRGWRQSHLEPMSPQADATESPLLCPRCGSEMRLIAVITDPAEVRKILRHLLQIGRAPPGLHPSALN